MTSMFGPGGLREVSSIRPAKNDPSVDHEAETVVGKVRLALRPEHRLAAFCGLLFGAFVPTASYVLVHNPAERLDTRPFMWLAVLAALVYSGLSTYAFGCAAFGSKTKSAAFVVLTEVVLVFSLTDWLGAAALALLVAVNSISAACGLALEGRRRP